MGIKKRIIAIALAGAIAATSVGAGIAFLPSNTGIVAEATGELKESGSFGEGLRWYFYNDGKLEIKYINGEGTMPNDSAPWSNYRSQITKIEIADGVSNIGNSAFCKCPNLTSVTIPNSVKTIGRWAFDGCSSLKSINVGDGVTSIIDSAFLNCSSLESITLGKSFKRTGTNVFKGCTNLKKVNYTGTINDWVKIEFYDEWANPTRFAKDLYIKNKLVTDVYLTEGTSIMPYAFYNCKSIASVTLPKSIKDIADNAFYDEYGSTNLKNVYYQGNEYDVEDIEFNSGNTRLSIDAKWNYDQHIHSCDPVWQYEKKQHYLVCNGCGEMIGMEAHELELISTKQPTYTAEGSKTYKCKLCSYRRTDKIAKKVLPKVTVSSAANTATGLQIKWNKAAGAQGYKIYRKIGNGKWSVIATVGANTTAYNDTKVANGYRYTYAVRAYNGTAQGAYAAKTYVRLVRPTITKATNSASRRLTVQWTRNSQVTGYVILYQTGTTKKYIYAKNKYTYLKHIDRLVKGKTYNVYVRNYRTLGGVNYYSAWSPVKTVKITK